MAFERLRQAGFNIGVYSYSDVLFDGVFPDAMAEIENVLLDLRIGVSELVAGGGGEGSMTQRLRRALSEGGWPKRKFSIAITVDGEQPRPAKTHEIDHVREHERGRIALEIEWNNKDPFYDRDLENFSRLHANSVIAVGAIITRGASLQASAKRLIQSYAERHGIGSIDDLPRHNIPQTARQRTNLEQALQRSGRPFAETWAHLFVQDKFGEATTHWNKLMTRPERGVGNPCPWIAIGIPASSVEED